MRNSRLLLIVTISSLAFNVFSQNQFQRMYRGLGGNESLGYTVSGFSSTTDGNLFIAGSMNLSVETSGTFILKVDSAGDVLWGKIIYTGSGIDYLLPTSDGGYLINTVEVRAFLNWNHGVLLIKLDQDGNELWSKAVIKDTSAIDYNSNNRAFHSIETFDGDFLTIAEYSSQDPLPSDILLIKSDSSGNTIFSKNLGTSDHESPTRILRFNNSYFIIGKYFNQSANEHSVLLTKLDGNGNVFWAKTYEASLAVSVIDAVTTHDGFYITGTEDSSTYIAKIDTAGNFLFARSFGNDSLKLTPASVTATQDSGVAVTGYSHGKLKAFLIKFNSVGDTLFTKTYGNDISTRAFKVMELGSELILAGTRTATNQDYTHYPSLTKISQPSDPQCSQEISSIVSFVNNMAFTDSSITLQSAPFGKTISENYPAADLTPTDTTTCAIIPSNIKTHDNPEHAFDIFPNPAAGELWFSTTNPDNNKSEIKVYNAREN